ncbi:MAG: PstS family phosphate ABC transporter substrate-binding protein [Desulfomonile tiedjei]|nr:PstS family phosphate ABC transporter substrate-binding protein [Desulfomonile tiedjei]
MKRILLSVFGAFLVGFCMMISVQRSDASTVIRVKGTDEMAGRVDAQAKAFLKDHPGFTVMVSGGSTAMGLPDLVDGNCEVVMAGHELTGEDEKRAAAKGVNLVRRLVGYGAIPILIHPDNPVNELTVEQVKKLMKGEYTSWNQVGGPDVPVLIVALEGVSSTLMFLTQDFLQVPSLKSQVVRVLSYRSIIQKVSDNKGALGYSRLRDLEGREGPEGVKVLKIKKDPDSPGVAPSRRTIADESYPIRRPFSLWLGTNASPDVKTFVDFVVAKGWGAQLK